MASMPPSPPPSPPPLSELWLPEFDAVPGASDAFASLSPLPSSSSSEGPAEPRRSRAPTLAIRRRRAYRLRKKSETSELRAAFELLTQERDKLVKWLEKRNKQLLAAEDCQRFARGWRGVAARQLQRRSDAETLHCQLRAQLAQANGQAQQLVGLLASHRSLLEGSRLQSLMKTQPPKEPLSFSPQDMDTVQNLAKEVAGLVHHAGDRLGQCRLPALTDSQAYNYSRAWRRRPEARSEHFELIQARRVAFPFREAIAALEKTLALMLAMQCQPAVRRLLDNMVALKFSSSALRACVKTRRRGDWRASTSARWPWTAAERRYAGGAYRAARTGATNRLEETGWGMVERENERDDGTSFSYLSHIEGKKKAIKTVKATEEETAVWFDAMESIVMDRGPPQ